MKYNFVTKETTPDRDYIRGMFVAVVI